MNISFASKIQHIFCAQQTSLTSTIYVYKWIYAENVDVHFFVHYFCLSDQDIDAYRHKFNYIY